MVDQPIICKINWHDILGKSYWLLKYGLSRRNTKITLLSLADSRRLNIKDIYNMIEEDLHMAHSHPLPEARFSWVRAYRWRMRQKRIKY